MSKYPLNGSHLTDADDRAMIATVADWPLGDRLPLKRRSEAGRPPEHGVMYADEFLVIRRTGTTPPREGDIDDVHVYSTVDELVDDGWQVD